MTDRTMQDVLDRLDAQEAELAALRAERTTTSRRLRLPGKKRSRFVALGVTALLVALVPLSILAANPFPDLQTGSVHNGDIDTIYNLGITNGFQDPAFPNDPTKRIYAPTNNVTRQEMASFLARTAALNRIAFTSRPSAGDNVTDNLGAGPSKPYMNVTLVVPGVTGGSKTLVKVDFTGYAFARSTAVATQNPGCPCLVRGEITVDGETAGGTPAVNPQVVTRTVVGANPLAIVAPGPAERVDFSGSRVFTLAPGTYTFTMTLVREAGTAENIGFGFGNMQAETVGFVGDGTRVAP